MNRQILDSISDLDEFPDDLILAEEPATDAEALRNGIRRVRRRLSDRAHRRFFWVVFTGCVLALLLVT